ncbi:MAG: hypothetical protein GX847_12650, partial [Clostridiales bacterium]|nr:hypothetical protein [Clostridiales bacterium]
IEGRGSGLRLDGKLGFGATAVTTGRGIEITQGGGIYLLRTLKGKTTLDCRWELKALRSTDPVITVEPDQSGALEIAVFDTDDAYELPVLAESLDQSSADSEDDFEVFKAGLMTTAAGSGAVFDSCAYGLWLGFQSFKGRELASANKMSDQNIYAFEQPFLTLPLTDASRAVDIICHTLSFMTPQGMVPAWFSQRQNLYEAVPPVYAFAVSRLIESGRIGSVPHEKLSALYKAMEKAIGWWIIKRAGDNGLVCYAYRHECGWPKEPIFNAGLPCAAPDLQTYIILAAEALSKIAAILGKTDLSAYWEDVYRRQLAVLTDTLWDGAGMSSVNGHTGASAPAEGMLSVLPLILGRRPPESMRGPLAEKAKALVFEELPVLPAALIIMGLKASKRDDDAKAAAASLITSCVSGGVSDSRGRVTGAGTYYSPAACAALLALGGSAI